MFQLDVESLGFFLRAARERDGLAAEKALLTRRLKSYSQGTTRGELLDGTPPGTEIAYYRDGVFTRLGVPYDDDHNCDAMGCGQSHVIQRVNVAALESLAEDARTVCAKVVATSSAAWFAGEFVDAARRVLGQLPPRPVVDLDDVRMVRDWVDRHSSVYDGKIVGAANRILAALGAKS